MSKVERQAKILQLVGAKHLTTPQDTRSMDSSLRH